MRKSRTLAKRRDRRKAKASKWKRAPKKMGGKVGHGSSLTNGIVVGAESKAVLQKKRAGETSSLRVRLRDFVNGADALKVEHRTVNPATAVIAGSSPARSTISASNYA